MEELKKTSRKEVVEQKLIAKSANAQFESLKTSWTHISFLIL
jgi:hypothetical protein